MRKISSRPLSLTPTEFPTDYPTVIPTHQPTDVPSVTFEPSGAPTVMCEMDPDNRLIAVESDAPPIDRF